MGNLSLARSVGKNSSLGMGMGPEITLLDTILVCGDELYCSVANNPARWPDWTSNYLFIYPFVITREPASCDPKIQRCSLFILPYAAQCMLSHLPSGAEFIGYLRQHTNKHACSCSNILSQQVTLEQTFPHCDTNVEPIMATFVKL